MSESVHPATERPPPVRPSVLERRRDYSMFDADLTGQMFNLSLLRRLMHWMRPYTFTLLVSAGLILLASSLQVLLPIVVYLVGVDHIIKGNTGQDTPDMGLIAATEWIAGTLAIHPLFAACVLFGLLQLGWAVASHLHRLTLSSSIVNSLRDLRHDLFAHLETRPSSFFDRVAVGRVLTRVTNDVEALYEALRGLGTLLGEFVPFFVALIIMFSASVKLTLILLAALPLVGIVTYFFRRATRQLFRMVRMSVSSLNQNLQENLSGLAVVQLSERQNHNLRRYGKLNENNRDLELRSTRLEVLYSAFNDSMASVALGVVIWYGGGQVVQNAVSLGEMLVITQYINMLFQPVVAFGEQMNVLFRAMASGERIFQALDWDEAIHEPRDPLPLPKRLAGEVEFRNCSFWYDPDVQILDDVSFTIASGEKLAIVGPTGSGKSTLIRLLSRFYDFDDAMIFLDGIDLNRIHSHDLRRRIGVVMQDFHIFSGTIYDNIALGNAAVTRERAMEAARTVNAHNFISALPRGYDTELAERGQNLSQGQRQLLAFARVLAADPEILVLDEATASIDTETELLIQDGLRKLMAGRTSIIIAHRLQTIQEADRVMVLHHGEVAEIGTHEELLAHEGLYFTLHSLQFQDISTEEVDELTGEDEEE